MDDSKTSQALTKRNAETSLMPPPPPPKRIKRPTKVLDEDVYTDTLSHIIARDFFPGLLETEAQQGYLTALDSNNTDWIREAGRKLHQAMTPGPGGRGRRGTSMAATPRNLSDQTTSATPRGWGGDTPRRAAPSETPMSNTGDDQPKRLEVDPSLSLGAFQTKYTSEDNESFNALLDRQNIKRAEKYAFLHNANKIPTARQLEYRKQQQIASSDSTALSIRPSQNLADRPAQVEGFKSKQGAKNSLMFGPDSIEDTHTTVFQAAADASLAAPKAVNYASTRLSAPVAANPESSIPPSPSMSAIDAAIAGRPRASETDVGYSGSETPRVAGYTFVDAEPTPSELGVPISDEEAERQEREAAMALMPRLDSETEKGGFKLQSQSKREELHHRIVDKQNSQRRKPGDRLGVLKGAATPGATPKFDFSPSVAVAAAAGQKKVVGGSLTPAARLLADRIGRTPRREGQGSSLFGGQKEKSRAWTPTPRLVRKG